MELGMSRKTSYFLIKKMMPLINFRNYEEINNNRNNLYLPENWLFLWRQVDILPG